LARGTLALLSLLALAVTGYGWSQYQDLLSGIGRSQALRADAPHSTGGDTNILIMGLDSRLDENGNPLPRQIYQALHAGDQQVGGYNANVLMLVHLPGDGRRATVLSIPRDDYVEFPGHPDGVARGKIKKAYGLAVDEERKRLVAAGVSDQLSLEQRSREAGRREQVDTVSQFLGVPIDHFVEVTMVAFYQLAQMVEPITVCLNEDTRDSYSGANFHRGYQQINASQAVAFVRQRRDYTHPELNFTDLDRERRQQAFIASLVYQLKQAGTFLHPARMRALINVVKQNIAADAGFELLSFAPQAAALSSGNITFTTLPITGFGTDPAGEDINIVDVPQIQALVRRLTGEPGATPAAPSSPPAAASASGVVDVVNATTRNGLAAGLERALAGTGFTPGVASTAPRLLPTTRVYYPDADAAAAASALSGMVGGVPVARDPSVPAGHLRVVLGADYAGPTIGPAPVSPPVSPGSPGAGTGSPDPGAGGISGGISGGGIPCVK
jgi:LCP family protein required for cell wall assembly